MQPKLMNSALRDQIIAKVKISTVYQSIVFKKRATGTLVHIYEGIDVKYSV